MCRDWLGVIEVRTKPLYTRHLKWTFEEYSYWVSAAVAAELTGAVLGGFLADIFGRRTVMTMGFGGYGLLAIVYASQPDLWLHDWFSTGYLFLNPGFIAMGAVGYNSMGMELSWTRASATMLTIYMTLSNVGHVADNRLIGRLRDQWELTYRQTLFVGGLCMLLPLALILLIQPAQVDRARAENTAGAR